MKLTESTAIIKALADSSRLLILNALLEKPQYVEELSERLNLAASTISFHLKKMEQANLVHKVKEQYYTMFHANRDVFGLTLQELVNIEDIETAVQEERIQQYKQKVLRSFFKHGKVTRMPAQQKKRWIVLEEISTRFEKGRTYTEQEVNQIIADLCEDYCLVRREFVEERIMARKDGVYWMVDDDSDAPATALRRSYQESVASMTHAHQG